MEVCGLLVGFRLLLSGLSCICYKGVTTASGPEPQSHTFKDSRDFDVDCVCVTYLHSIFARRGGCTVISQCLK